jgi:hypothetical protein
VADNKVTDLFVGRLSVPREENPPMAGSVVDELPQPVAD